MANRQFCRRFCSQIASSIGNLISDASYAALAESIRAALVAAKCRMIERAAKVVYDCLPTSAARVVVTKAGAVPGLASASVSFP